MAYTSFWAESSASSKKKKSSSQKTKTAKPKSGKQQAKENPAVLSYTYADPEAPGDAQEFELKKRVKSQAEAERLAKAKLRELNAKIMTGQVTLVGDPSIAAGVVIAVKGFGSFDGNFIVEEARHSVSSSGYTTELRLRRVNTEY